MERTERIKHILGMIEQGFTTGVEETYSWRFTNDGSITITEIF